MQSRERYGSAPDTAGRRKRRPVLRPATDTTHTGLEPWQLRTSLVLQSQRLRLHLRKGRYRNSYDRGRHEPAGPYMSADVDRQDILVLRRRGAAGAVFARHRQHVLLSRTGVRIRDTIVRPCKRANMLHYPQISRLARLGRLRRTEHTGGQWRSSTTKHSFRIGTTSYPGSRIGTHTTNSSCVSPDHDDHRASWPSQQGRIERTDVSRTASARHIRQHRVAGRQSLPSTFHLLGAFCLNALNDLA
jgi:hypothetical protein